MAIVVVSLGAAHANNNTTVSLTVPAGGVPPGALICQNYANTQGVPASQTRTYSDSAANTYQEKNVTANASGGLAALASAYNCSALSSGNFIKCVLSASTNLCLSVFYVTGVQTASDPYDSACAAANNGTGTSFSLTSGTPAASNTLLVTTLCLLSNATSFSDPAGWTAIDTDVSGGTGTNIRVRGGTQVSSGAQTYNPSWTNSARWAAVITGFKPAVAVVAPPMPMRAPFVMPGGLLVPVGGAAALLEAMKRNPTLARRSFFDLSRWREEQ